MLRNLFRINSIPKINVQDLKAKLDVGEKVVLLDVRDPHEFTGDGHIAGARLIPLSALAHRLAELDKDAPTYCICLSGSRSHVACSMLQRQGFTHVTNVVGGMGSWVRSGLPVKRGAK